MFRTSKCSSSGRLVHAGLCFLYNKTNRRTNFQIYSGTKLYMFRAIHLPIIRSYRLYIQHWHMLYRFEDSLRAEWVWNCSSILILNASCLQTCITCASAEYTVDNSWWWAEELPETCRVSYQNKFGKLARLLILLQRNNKCTFSYTQCIIVHRDISF